MFIKALTSKTTAVANLLTKNPTLWFILAAFGLPGSTLPQAMSFLPLPLTCPAASQLK
jgi:hypothetical protein